MKGKIRHPLREALTLSAPAVAAGTTADDYVACLMDSAGVSRAGRVAVRTFQRWLGARQSNRAPVTVNEELLSEFAHDMDAGVLRPVRGRHSRRRYAATAREAPACIGLLHNRRVERDPRILRRLVDLRSMDRYRFFRSLTQQTQQAMIWFEENGVRPRRARMGGMPLTVASRRAAVTESLTLLRRLGLSGLEQVQESQVLDLVPKTGPEDPDYRRVVHMLNNAKPLFRACKEQGLLVSNPLHVIPHNSFTSYAVRDFLPPEALARIRDIETDRNELRDQKRLSDRLVLLLLADTAMRCGELASLERGQLRRCRDGYAIDLRAQNQKGADKPTVVLPILYPETNWLLEDYLRWRDKVPDAGATSLILNLKKRNVSNGAIANAVRREGRCLNIRTYYKNHAPTPHDLRRTFAMCNAAPLGLNMQAHELADRLRDDIQVVFTHYCRNNPLIAGKRAEVYRGRLNGKCSAEDALSMVDKLEALGVSQETVSVLRKEVRKATGPKPGEHGADAAREWMPEEEAVRLLCQEWGHMPARRKLRDYLRGKGGIDRSREHGRLRYDAAVVRTLLEEYTLVSSLGRMFRTGPSAVTGDPGVIRIGRDRLLPKKTVWSLRLGRAGIEQDRKAS